MICSLLLRRAPTPTSSLQRVKSPLDGGSFLIVYNLGMEEVKMDDTDYASEAEVLVHEAGAEPAERLGSED